MKLTDDWKEIKFTNYNGNIGKEIKDKNSISYTYGMNSIEGSVLSLFLTKLTRLHDDDIETLVNLFKSSINNISDVCDNILDSHYEHPNLKG